MAKDPAVLFYYQDFLVGTEFMSDEEVGKYIRILCHQADKGKLTEKQVLSVCKAHAIPECIKEKFLIDENGLYYNKRMLEEKEKRSNYVESRRKSALSPKSIRTAYAQRMEDENENINVNVFKEEKVISSVPDITIQEVEHYFESCGYSKTDAQNFFSYYSSQNWETKGGASIKARWQNKVIQWMNQQKQYSKPKIPDHGNLHPSTKENCDYCGKPAGLWIDGFAACNYDHYLKAKQKARKK